MPGSELTWKACWVLQDRLITGTIAHVDDKWEFWQADDRNYYLPQSVLSGSDVAAFDTGLLFVTNRLRGLTPNEIDGSFGHYLDADLTPRRAYLSDSGLLYFLDGTSFYRANLLKGTVANYIEIERVGWDRVTLFAVAPDRERPGADRVWWVMGDSLETAVLPFEGRAFEHQQRAGKSGWKEATALAVSRDTVPP